MCPGVKQRLKAGNISLVFNFEFKFVFRIECNINKSNIQLVGFTGWLIKSSLL